jgi:hypothetical protein
MKKTKNISRLWHSLSIKRYGSVKVAYWWRAFTNDRKPNITLLIPDLGLHPDNHLRCSVFIQTYFSGSSYTSSKPWWRCGGYQLLGYNDGLPISFSSSNTVQSSNWVQSHYCPCWLWQQRCKPYLQVQVKNSLVVRLCDVVAQYPMCEGCSISLYFLVRRNACRLKFWHIGQGITLCDR